MNDSLHTPPFSEHVSRRIRAAMAEQENELRELLGLWVSELEPEMVFQRGRDGVERFIGLTFAGVPIGREAPICLYARLPR